jgi:hypothetical protein
MQYYSILVDIDIRDIMQNLPNETLLQYPSALKANRIADRIIPHYVKWLRYFIDFTGKYDYVVQEVRGQRSVVREEGKRGRGEEGKRNGDCGLLK